MVQNRKTMFITGKYDESISSLPQALIGREVLFRVGNLSTVEY